MIYVFTAIGFTPGGSGWYTLVVDKELVIIK